MPHRRKRLKSAHPGCEGGIMGTPDPLYAVESMVQVTENSIPPQTGSSIYDGGSFPCRCSVRSISEVVSRFDEIKKGLVRSIGFDGILQFPSIKQINRKFTLWLMSCVDVKTSTLKISQDVCFGFNKFDVGHVFGIPVGGKCVLDSIAARSDAKDRVIDQFLGVGFKEQRNTKIVQEIIEREYGMAMTKHERDCFRVAFVVFVVSNLMSPSAKHNYASVDYWNAIQDPEGIASYDWCEFVITKLLEGVAKLNLDIMNNIKFPNISGCALFLQVLYLDSIDLGGLSMPHDRLPRIRVFSNDVLMNLILAEKNFTRYCRDDCSLPTAKLRDPRRCIYSWAVQWQENSAESRTGSLLAIWESAVAMVHLLDIPVEAAGPLFVAVFEFHEQINAGLVVTGMEAVKFLSVLVSLMIPFRRGFRYRSTLCRSLDKIGNVSFEDSTKKGTRLLACPMHIKLEDSCDVSIGQPANGIAKVDGISVLNKGAGVTSSGISNMFRPTYVGDVVQRPLKRAFGCIDNLPHSLNTNLRAAATMAQFYDGLRGGKLGNGFDLNNSDAAESSSVCDTKRVVDPDHSAVVSPWELCYQWHLCDEMLPTVLDSLRVMQDDPRLAIIHRQPKYVQVSWNSMYEQLTCQCEMDLDLFDAAVRLATQEDDLLYSGKPPIRWRYFFESDFLGNITGGMLDLCDSRLRDHLSLSQVSYDLRQCNLVFFPALIQCHWMCAAWLPRRNVLLMFDPSFDHWSNANLPVSDGRLQQLKRVGYMLKMALRTLIGSVFLGVEEDPTCADVFVLNFNDREVGMQLSSSYRSSWTNCSGVLCSVFYRCFDGCDLITNIDKMDAHLAAAKLFNDLRYLKGNSGMYEPGWGALIGG